MGIKDKLPLLKSSHKLVRLSGYVIYTFLAIIVLGGILPSPEVDESSSVTTTTAVKASSTADPKEKIKLEDISEKIDCSAIKDELNRARAIYWQNGVNHLTTRQKELIDHCGVGRERDYAMPTTAKEETTKKTSTSNQPSAETMKNSVDSESSKIATSKSLDEIEKVSADDKEDSSPTTKAATISTTGSASTITTATPSTAQTSSYTSSNTRTTSATYTKSASVGRKYVGSTKSNKYHYPSCSSAKNIKPENEIWFSSPVDAKAHGYEPCGRCNPPR